MKKLDPTMAQQVAQAIRAFQEQRTGYPRHITIAEDLQNDDRLKARTLIVLVAGNLRLRGFLYR